MPRYVTTPTTEAEYIEMAKLAEDALFIGRIGFLVPGGEGKCTSVGEHNEGPINPANNHLLSLARSGHTDVRNYSPRKKVANGDM